MPALASSSAAKSRDKSQRSAGKGVVARDVPTDTSRRAGDEDDLVLISLFLKVYRRVDCWVYPRTSMGPEASDMAYWPTNRW